MIAGVNGAGKSTLYASKRNSLDSFELGQRINADEIVREFFGHRWKDANVQTQAARIAVNKINEYLGNKVSFNQETTLAGSGVTAKILKAKKLGFKVKSGLYCGVRYRNT